MEAHIFITFKPSLKIFTPPPKIFLFKKNTLKNGSSTSLHTTRFLYVYQNGELHTCPHRLAVYSYGIRPETSAKHPQSQTPPSAPLVPPPPVASPGGCTIPLLMKTFHAWPKPKSQFNTPTKPQLLRFIPPPLSLIYRHCPLATVFPSSCHLCVLAHILTFPTSFSCNFASFARTFAQISPSFPYFAYFFSNPGLLINRAPSLPLSPLPYLAFASTHRCARCQSRLPTDHHPTTPPRTPERLRAKKHQKRATKRKTRWS